MGYLSKLFKKESASESEPERSGLTRAKLDEMSEEAHRKAVRAMEHRMFYEEELEKIRNAPPEVDFRETGNFHFAADAETVMSTVDW